MQRYTQAHPIFLIRLAVLQLSVEEPNRLLKIGRKEILYPRVWENIAVIYALEKKLTVSAPDPSAYSRT